MGLYLLNKNKKHYFEETVTMVVRQNLKFYFFFFSSFLISILYYLRVWVVSLLAVKEAGGRSIMIRSMLIFVFPVICCTG